MTLLNSCIWGLALVSRSLLKGLGLLADMEAFLLGLVSVSDWAFQLGSAVRTANVVAVDNIIQIITENDPLLSCHSLFVTPGVTCLHIPR